MIKKINTVLLILLLSFLKGASQNSSDFREKFKINIHKATSKIKIDGLLDEDSWQTADQTSDFWKKLAQTMALIVVYNRKTANSIIK